MIFFIIKKKNKFSGLQKKKIDFLEYLICLKIYAKSSNTFQNHKKNIKNMLPIYALKKVQKDSNLFKFLTNFSTIPEKYLKLHGK